MYSTTLVDANFFQDICISLQTDPLALKYKSHSNIFSHGDVHIMDSQILNSKVIDLEEPNSSVPCPRIHRSHEGEMPQDDIDPRFQFCDGLLYFEELLYVPEGPCWF